MEPEEPPQRVVLMVGLPVAAVLVAAAAVFGLVRGACWVGAEKPRERTADEIRAEAELPATLAKILPGEEFETIGNPAESIESSVSVPSEDARHFRVSQLVDAPRGFCRVDLVVEFPAAAAAEMPALLEKRFAKWTRYAEQDEGGGTEGSLRGWRVYSEKPDEEGRVGGLSGVCLYEGAHLFVDSPFRVTPERKEAFRGFMERAFKRLADVYDAELKPYSDRAKAPVGGPRRGARRRPPRSAAGRGRRSASCGAASSRRRSWSPRSTRRNRTSR